MRKGYLPFILIILIIFLIWDFAYFNVKRQLFLKHTELGMQEMFAFSVNSGELESVKTFLDSLPEVKNTLLVSNTEAVKQIALEYNLKDAANHIQIKKIPSYVKVRFNPAVFKVQNLKTVKSGIQAVAPNTLRIDFDEDSYVKLKSEHDFLNLLMVGINLFFVLLTICLSFFLRLYYDILAKEYFTVLVKSGGNPAGLIKKETLAVIFVIIILGGASYLAEFFWIRLTGFAIQPPMFLVMVKTAVLAVFFTVYFVLKRLNNNA